MSKSFYFLSCLLCLTGFSTKAQHSWLPTSLGNAFSRYDDMEWRNPDLGYVIDFQGPQNQSRLFKTTDGGQNWQALQGPVGFKYRSIAFMTDQVGFIGKLNRSLVTPADTFTLYRTTDAGQSWAPVPISGVPSERQGFCGMSVVNDQVMYACGQYFGPAYVYKTTDGGTTWTSMDLNALAGGLVDCHFWSPDSGIVVGTAIHPDFNQRNSRILFTADGGQTWQVRYTSTRAGENCWKISFPSTNVGYVSIQAAPQQQDILPVIVLKTTDKGQTWQEQLVTSTAYNAQGIGFLNDSTGWLGGQWIGNMVYHTTDGGQTWSQQQLGNSLNRFRFFGDTLGYVSGDRVFKLQKGVTGVPELLPVQNSLSLLSPPVPNPAAGSAAVTVSMPESGPARLRLLDALGREVRLLRQDQLLQAGQTELRFGLEGIAPGLYLLQLHTAAGVQGQRLVVGQ